MSIDVRPPSGVWHPGYISGRWYGTFPANTGNTTSVADTIYLTPFEVYRPFSITNIAFNETAAATTSQSARGAVYADVAGAPSGAPLREGAASLDLVANGISSADIALTSAISLNVGIIWIAFWFQTSGGTFAQFGRISGAGSNSSVIGATSAIGALGLTSGGASGYTMSSAFGASFPTLASLSAASITPFVAVKAA